MAQYTLWFDENTYLSARQSGAVGHTDAPFVIIQLGEKREGHTIGGHSRGRRKVVIARGRLEGDRMRVTRGTVSTTQIRNWLRASGYATKVVGTKKR